MVSDTELEDVVEESEEKERSKLGKFLLGTAAVGYLVGETVYKGGKATVDSVSKAVKGTKEAVDEYGQDVKRGYQIGTHVSDLTGHLYSVVKDAFEGKEPQSYVVDEESPLGLKTAEEYRQRRDSVPEEQQGPVSLATWGVGFWPGVLAYVISWPFRAVYNCISKGIEKRRERKASQLEEMLEE